MSRRDTVHSTRGAQRATQTRTPTPGRAQTCALTCARAARATTKRKSSTRATKIQHARPRRAA
uniref:Uncharacterized protein n=1 Tax=Arundo donax TaxID=35708 RepID=A0A0A9HNA5_ARUDO